MTSQSATTSTLTWLVMIGLVLSPISASAGPNKPHHRKDPHREPLSWAKVVSATAVYEPVRTVTPETECWTEQVTYEHRSNRVDSPVPMILGATVGGILGRGFGHRRSSKRRGTVVGAILGGTIGHQIGRGGKNSPSHSQRSYRDEERCETVSKVTWEDELRGYDVVYRYNGREYETHMTDAPGDRIRVIVNVVPAQ